MPNVCKLQGKRFGRLSVLERYGTDYNGRAMWRCLCDCGNYCVKTSQSLKRDRAPSCGCWAKEIEREVNTIHGFNNTRLYTIFRGILKRCYVKTNKAYKNYGGRGITVCDEWLLDRSKFFQWAVSNGYNENLTIERIDNSRGYSPDNCKWITNTEQQSNKRSNHLVTYKGETHTVTEWERMLGMNHNTLLSRLSKYHWSVEKAIETPVKQYNWKRNK